MTMTDAQLTAYRRLMTTGDDLGRIITHARSSMQPLDLPDAVVKKVIEAQQSVFEAQRLIEKLCR